MAEAIKGLLGQPKTLAPWLFYDAEGSLLFEQITALPEYYLSRTERKILTDYAPKIVSLAFGRHRVMVVELGAGTAVKTGIFLSELARRQGTVSYHPIDVSATALRAARLNIEASIPGITVSPQITDYTVEALNYARPPDTRVLLMYLGSSIGNFSPPDALDLLLKLRGELLLGDLILIGADRVKDKATLVSAYDDTAGVTAAFNLNVLRRLNREIGTDFRLSNFKHLTVWNPTESRIEMHLESKISQQVRIPASPENPQLEIQFVRGETIHTENSYKFSSAMMGSWLLQAGFTPIKEWSDADYLYSLTLAEIVSK
ncbi:L-histidine N(alpha)-methyltransferase [Granulicella mallensis]|uniref:Dimethylhistidine N-methyltransferase n=1 Tax=Granulicella mallensis TaxID=940614 RepID=A0A7W8EB25_9BACT|nr:L-histidine N(alpha)-methyltransferase [Granulicella mallensis]MBB5066258.1 dimethylhistidine N-methyltransferase [Granulicella mallensis]